MIGQRRKAFDKILRHDKILRALNGDPAAVRMTLVGACHATFPGIRGGDARHASYACRRRRNQEYTMSSRGLAITVATGLVLFSAAVAPAVERPNVLLILTDDQGWGDIRSHGNDRIDTPVLDRLAASGARFDRFYVSPVCAPTRASLLTGRYHLRSGVHGVTRAYETMRAE